MSKTQQLTKDMLDQFDLSLFYDDGHTIKIFQGEKVMCQVDTSNCNDDKQVLAIVSAFLQGLHCSIINY